MNHNNNYNNEYYNYYCLSVFLENKKNLAKGEGE